MGNINWLRGTFGWTMYELSNLFQTFQGDTDLNTPRCLLTEAEKVNSCRAKAVKCSCGSHRSQTGLYFGYFAFNSFSYWAHYAKGR